MRFYSVSWRGLWRDAMGALRRLGKQWIPPTLLMLAGLGLGIWLATFVADPTYTPVLLRVLHDGYKPFGVGAIYLLCLASLLVLCYLSCRFRHRIPYLLGCALAGYVMGRIALFCVVRGVLGIVGLLLFELPMFLLCFLVSLAYYAHHKDALFCSLRPQFNRGAISFGLRCMVWGGLFLLAICLLWGLLAALINIVV